VSRPLVTANSITAQARKFGRVELPANALITPAARDRLQGTNLPVTWLDAETEPSTRVGLYLVGDASNPTCQALLPVLERSLGGVNFWSCQGHRAGLLAALRNATDALAKCSQRRGAVIVRDGGIVQCVANHEAHVRAVVYDRPTRLTAYMRELAPNLLILEHERLSLGQMRGMLETFIRGETGMDPVIESALHGDSKENSATECRCQHADR